MENNLLSFKLDDSKALAIEEKKSFSDQTDTKKVRDFFVKKIKKKRVLFVGAGVITKELLNEESFSNNYKAINVSIDEKLHLDISKYIQKLNIKQIIIGSSVQVIISNNVIKQLVDARFDGVKLYDEVGYFEKITGRTPIVHLSAEWYLNDDIFSINTNRYYFKMKRCFDFMVALTTLPFASVLILFGMLLIKITSRGPMIFRQCRIGKGGKPFSIFKIRTMSIHESGDQSKNKITKIGRILRLTKIDELPQLFNILRGEMSLVGPRPEQCDIVEMYKQENPYYNLRHMIRPGVTGWAQVNHPKATHYENLQKLEYDLFYVKKLTPKLDFGIFLQTIKIVFTLNSN